MKLRKTFKADILYLRELAVLAVPSTTAEDGVALRSLEDGAPGNCPYCQANLLMEIDRLLAVLRQPSEMAVAP